LFPNGIHHPIFLEASKEFGKGLSEGLEEETNNE